jgi:uncharacterized protein YjbI with pentapeptide repeats
MDKITLTTGPKTGKRLLETFALGVIGIYIILFFVASQRYEYKTNMVKKKVQVLLTQLETPAYKSALSSIPAIQQMQCPVKPDYRNPASLFHSFLTDTTCPEINQQLRKTVETWKTALDSVNLMGMDLKEANLLSAFLAGSNLSRAHLSNANLVGAHLMGGNFSRIDLVGANLFGADLSNANLSDAHLARTNFVKANLNWVNLTGANLSDANLIEASFLRANLSDAHLAGANLWGAKFLTIQQLSGAKSLFQVRNLPSGFREQLEKDCPHLFEEPGDEE